MALREQIKSATTTEQLAQLLREAEGYRDASDKTKRQWLRAFCVQRTKGLVSDELKAAIQKFFLP